MSAQPPPTTTQTFLQTLKTRNRSLSPHARASPHSHSFLSTFSRTRSRSSSSHSRRTGTTAASSSPSPSDPTSGYAYPGGMEGGGEDDGDISVTSYESSNSSSTGSLSSAGGYGRGDQVIIAVTSCRSEGYTARADGGGELPQMLPRKAPSALKTFHELAIGVRDAYEAVGATPTGLVGEGEEGVGMGREEVEGRNVLYGFMGNLSLLLNLVNEVASDTATRNSLKDDSTFKPIRDVIKKCNKNILDRMLVRRESRYMLFFRIIRPNDKKEIGRMKNWNRKMTKAFSAFGGGSGGGGKGKGWGGEGEGGGGEGGGGEGNRGRRRSWKLGKGTFKERRATPTPTLRRRFLGGSKSSSSSSVTSSIKQKGSTESSTAGETVGSSEQQQAVTSADDGYATESIPMTQSNLARLQQNIESKKSDEGDGVVAVPGGQFASSSSSSSSSSSVHQGGAIIGGVVPMAPKDELVDVIRSLREEKETREESNKSAGNTNNGTTSSSSSSSASSVISGNTPEELKPNWHPMTEVPETVPMLPKEYIHRHRLMKQVVNSLLCRQPNNHVMGSPHPPPNPPLGVAAAPVSSPENNGGGGGGGYSPKIVTAITSRHADKAGNGKTTLACAAVQTIEVRQRFVDGIAWLRIGRNPLSERDVRRLYEELYDQLLGDDDGKKSSEHNENPKGRVMYGDDGLPVLSPFEPPDLLSSPPGSLDGSTDENENAVAKEILQSQRRYYGGDLDGIKEDLGRVLSQKKILIVLDDVWRPEDVQRFVFDISYPLSASSTTSGGGTPEDDVNAGTMGMPGRLNSYTTPQAAQTSLRTSNNSSNNTTFSQNPSYRILITTRTPNLLGRPTITTTTSTPTANPNPTSPTNNSTTQTTTTISTICLVPYTEIYVRILSEHEAIRLLLSSAGRRLSSGKQSPVHSQARIVVKGCGNSPLALRLAGGMLKAGEGRDGRGRWTLRSWTWGLLVEQCRGSLDEASRIRSFVNSVGRVVDLSFVGSCGSLGGDGMGRGGMERRVALRRCFVAFAMVFHGVDWIKAGRGVPRDVVVNFFRVVIGNVMIGGNGRGSGGGVAGPEDEVDEDNKVVVLDPEDILDTMERLNLIEIATTGGLRRGGYGWDGVKCDKNIPTAANVTKAGVKTKAKSLMADQWAEDGLTAISAPASRDGDGDGDGEDGEKMDLSYFMHESVKHIAEEMSTRTSPSYTPIPDEYTCFTDELILEKQHERKTRTGTTNQTTKPENTIAGSSLGGNSSDGNSWISSAANYLFSSTYGDGNGDAGGGGGVGGSDWKNGTMSDYQFHELMATSLTLPNDNDGDDSNQRHRNSQSPKKKQPSTSTSTSTTSQQSLPSHRQTCDQYTSTYLPFHLIRARQYKDASTLLTHEKFIQRRVEVLGVVEASRRHVGDLLDLRMEYDRHVERGSHSRTGGAISPIPAQTTAVGSHRVGDTDDFHDARQGLEGDDHGEDGLMDDHVAVHPPPPTIDTDKILNEASHLLVSTVSRTERARMAASHMAEGGPTEGGGGKKNTVEVAICLCIVAEGFLKSRKPREAIGILEDAILVYSKLNNANAKSAAAAIATGTATPNQYRLDHAMALTSLAKLYARSASPPNASSSSSNHNSSSIEQQKDRRTALLVAKEASILYVASSAPTFHDAVSNSQLIAYLSIEMKDWDYALSTYGSIVDGRIRVYGRSSHPVARTVNDFAVVLAKHGKLSEALHQYELSRGIFETLSSEENRDSSGGPPTNLTTNGSRFSFDVTLLDLNIASIKTKLGDYPSALTSYERGVAGLRAALERESASLPTAAPSPSSPTSPNNNTPPIIPDTSRIAAQRRHLVSAIGRIGSLKMKLRDNDGALAAYTALLREVSKNSPTASQMEKAKAHVKCATIYRQMGSMEGNASAIGHLERAFHMYTALHGPEHKDTRAIAGSLRQWQRMDQELMVGGGVGVVSGSGVGGEGGS